MAVSAQSEFLSRLLCKMSPTQSAMLNRISELKASTLAACANISTRLREGSPLKSDLKPLIVELRLLAGALFSLESLIVELGENSENDIPITETTDWPLLDGCEMLISAIQSFHTYATPDGLKAARSSLLDNRSKLGFVLGSSESLQDIVLQFSILGSNSIPQLMSNNVDTEMVESRPQTRDETEPSAEEVSAWLTILNSSDNDREPAEYNKEIALVQSRRITTNYRTAATRWPEYAERYWQKLRPQVCSLFRIQRSYSFVQWVLEYARETFPRALGPLALSPRLLLELTDALCDGSVSSLHIAAALGLPNLCRDLLSMGADINQTSILGTPLFCSLMGTKVLATRAEPESWGSLLVGGDSDVERAATILHLLDEGADCTYKYNWKNADEVSLAGLAFWVAMTTKHEAIFTRIMKGGSKLDGAFLELMQRETLVMRGLFHKARFARLLTFVYDLTLADIVSETLEYGELQKTVSQLMKHANIKFSFAEESGKITTLEDHHIPEVTRNAVLDFDVTLVERLTSDPRFDPNLPFGKNGLSGTILHTATEGSQLEIMDILIAAGADMGAIDSNERTPIMVVEDLSALSKLVLDHGASTTDTDKDGRTIWHLCALTNDVALLKWLWDYDPCRNENIRKKDYFGFTPLVASFAYIDTLAQPPRGLRQPVPLAARFMLEACRGHVTLKGNERLAEYAVQWGDANLVKKVFEIIPESINNNRFLLKYLNMSASNELLQLVLDKCRELPWQFPNGSTVVETIITNTKLTAGRYGAFAVPTAHPSCFPHITREGYERLLTPEVLKSRDNANRHLWVRFCDAILPLLSGTGTTTHPSSLYFLSGFINLAIRCLVERGVLADYENETGKCAILYIAEAKRTDGQPYWQGWQYPFVTTVLEAAEGSLQLLPSLDWDGPNSFVTSFQAVLLLQQAVHHKLSHLVKLLVDTGISVHRVWDKLLGVSLFEAALLDDVDLAMVRTLLSRSRPTELMARQFETFDKLHVLLETQFAVQVVIKLIERGMDPNLLPTNVFGKNGSKGGVSFHWSMLTEAICQHKSEIACALLENGADPALAASDGYNALIAACQNGQVVVLEEIIEREPDNLDWKCVFEEEDGVTYNALQTAAANSHRDILETLILATPLIDEIDATTPKNGLSPAHLAAKAGSLECIKVLAKFGADLTATDSSGRSPLFWAILRGNNEVVEYLKDSLLDPEEDREQDYGISVLDPVDSTDLSGGLHAQQLVSRPFHGRTPESIRLTEQRRLGHMIADAVSRHRPSSGGLFSSLLNHISKDELESAILPCDGCTLLSYTASQALISPMVELLELGFTGFVAGCQEHWPNGYNALVQGCLQIQKLLQVNIFTAPKKVYSFIEKCLDAYLAEGRLWFHLSQPPIHAICQYQQTIGGPDFSHQEKVLKIFIDHLVAHADEYWALLQRSGLQGLSDSADEQDTTKRLLRFVLNARSKVGMGSVYYGGNLSAPLHVLIQACARDNALEADPTLFSNMARMLISHGADVNARDTELLTPINSAAEYDLQEMVDLLLEAGADPNARDIEGTTPLGHAVVTGNIEMVRSLLKHGADPQTFDGMDFRNSGSDMDFVRELIGLGLDPYGTMVGNPSLLSTLINWGSVSRAYALSGEFDFYRLAENEPSFLIRLMPLTPSSSRLRAILRRVPRECRPRVVNFQPDSGLSAGCMAIRTENTDLLKLFLNFGFDFEREWCDKGSALMFAGYIGASKSFKLLVRHGARLSYIATDRHGGKVVRSVVEATRVYPKLLQWVLVGRHYEKKSITSEAHSGTFTATRLWSGPRKAAYRFDSDKCENTRRGSESMIDYLVRVSGVIRQLAGTVVPATLVE
ncbi:hypothetical protein CEP51_003696 [Fusarium floridanum]|uniref:Uncharacterized protein n=1 Tax=Fusarium floridanum TaxID=1325733 RepID=A0A428S4N4_9HYPO|nr:hypothetical protein CEP51_003696 [Fusarium floridanum]